MSMETFNNEPTVESQEQKKPISMEMEGTDLHIRITEDLKETLDDKLPECMLAFAAAFEDAVEGSPTEIEVVVNDSDSSITIRAYNPSETIPDDVIAKIENEANKLSALF